MPYQKATIIGPVGVLWLPVFSPQLSQAAAPPIQLVATYKCPRRTLVEGFSVSVFNINQPPAATDIDGFAAFLAYEGEAQPEELIPGLSAPFPSSSGPWIAGGWVPADRRRGPVLFPCRRIIEAGSAFTVQLSGLVSADAASFPMTTRAFVTPLGRFADEQDMTQGLRAV
jgi:hypothetical protein